MAATPALISPLNHYCSTPFTMEVQYPVLGFRYINLHIETISSPPGAPLNSSTIVEATKITLSGRPTLASPRTWIAELQAIARPSLNAFELRGGSAGRLALAAALVQGIMWCEHVIELTYSSPECFRAEWEHRRVALETVIVRLVDEDPEMLGRMVADVRSWGGDARFALRRMLLEMRCRRSLRRWDFGLV